MIKLIAELMARIARKFDNWYDLSKFGDVRTDGWDH